MATLFEFALAGRSYRVAISQSYFYLLPDGSWLPILAWPAWCETCREFTVAERVPTASKLGDKLREAEYFAERPGLIPPDRHINLAALPALRLRQKWRSARVAPAKCLTCGSTAVTSIYPGPEVDVPGHGTCVARFRGWADVTSGTSAQYYTPEGERVPPPPKQRQRRTGNPR